MEHLPVDVLRLFIVKAGHRTVVELNGEIDFASAVPLRDRLDMLIHAGTAQIDVDMSEVTFCDSTGLRVLLEAYRQLQERHGHMRIINPSAQVVRLFELTGINALLQQ